MSHVAARLERIPFCRVHFKLLIMGGLGFAFEALDAGIIASAQRALLSAP